MMTQSHMYFFLNFGLKMDKIEKAQVCSFKKVEKAVKALKKLSSTKSELLNETTMIWVSFTTRKIAEKQRIKPIPITISKSIVPPEAQICFISKDPQREYKDLFAKEGINVHKVIGITKLRQKYKAFEQKRELCSSYDLFLADSRVIEMLPKLLGKTFFDKKKQLDIIRHPAAVDMTKNPKVEIEKTIHSTFLHLNKGVCR